MPPVDRQDLDPALSATLSTQEYGAQQPIDGLRVLPLKAHRDDSGSFVELGRLDQAGALLSMPDFAVRQINHSVLLPGGVKAWHLHLSQDDVWFVPENSRVIAAFRDLRSDSPTKGQLQRTTLGGGQPSLVRIPAGVAHGLANPFETPAALIYLVDQVFDPKNPDERRLPWDVWGAEIWERTRG
jgi:dTDP-4-dehydrorhamnose 3,5-epimerase